MTVPTQDPSDIRDAPTEDFIARSRRLFPVEAELDRMLTRKMRKRAQPRNPAAYSLDALVGCLERFLEDHGGPGQRIGNPRWMAGGASKIQVAFTLDRPADGGGTEQLDLVMRMEPAESINTTSRLREVQLLDFFQDKLPVPKVRWLDDDARWFPEPAIIYDRASGVTRPTDQENRVSGIGQRFSTKLRQELAPQFMDALARIHTADPAAVGLEAFHRPELGTTESALLQLNRVRRVWHEDHHFSFPLFDAAGNWLERNLPVLDHATILHGDFRAGNFLFDEGSRRITAWLDWERGHIGDRHRDLAWTTTSSFGNLAEDGKTFLVSGLIPLDEFYHEYERRTGLPVDPARLRYYRIFNCYQIITTALCSAWRIVHLGKTHQDVLIAWVEGVGYSQAQELRRLLLEEL
ncbi:phosphotransferase family protein [Paracoccus sp. pheM1]|uniref:phosphotransferase family protein n=1 Tax=Paracoccus sp. pheM1 TaxID=2831675 RepID=UPI001F0A59CF|nr:phosphotransferase family protein [Paracoccus sp. pheM1]